MKTMIVNPPTCTGMKYIREGRCEQRLNSFQYVMVPISLPMIAGALEAKQHQVNLLDCIANDVDVEGLKKAIRDFDPAFVLFNMSTATSSSDVEVINMMRPLTQAHFTVIGNHATSLPEEVLQASGLDSVIRREPELTAQDLVDALEKGRGLGEVLGISFKDKDGTVVHNEDRPFNENLDDLPFAARHLLDNARYTLPVINEPYTLIITSRGCPYSCIYCTAHQYYGKKLRLRSAENVVDEMQECLEKHHIRNFTMWSDTFNQSKKFVMEVCAEIKKRGMHEKIKWMANSRVDHVDREVLKEMRSSGCIGVSYGVESGVDDILEKMKKGADAEQARVAVKLTKEAGIEVLTHIIFGLPGETMETIDQTIRYVKEMDPDYAQFYCAIPFPKTELEEMGKKNGWISTEDYAKYELNQPILNLPTLSMEQLQEARKRAYREFYLRPSYILKRLRKIRGLKDLVVNFRQAKDFISSWISKESTEKTPISRVSEARV
ncbi:MAG TPA: radical SAM protein [bacterium]|nr:radical SAM protein [bacterium]